MLMTEITLQNKDCLVDQCKVCENETDIICSECESGYYVRTFYGKEAGKNYNACWNSLMLLWGLLGVTLLGLSCCLCNYVAYKYGMKRLLRKLKKKDADSGKDADKSKRY